MTEITEPFNLYEGSAFRFVAENVSATISSSIPKSAENLTDGAPVLFTLDGTKYKGVARFYMGLMFIDFKDTDKL